MTTETKPVVATPTTEQMVETSHNTLLDCRARAMSAAKRLEIYGDTYYLMCELLSGSSLPQGTPDEVTRLVFGLIGHDDDLNDTVERVTSNYIQAWRDMEEVTSRALKTYDELAVLSGLTNLDKEITDEANSS